MKHVIIKIMLIVASLFVFSAASFAGDGAKALFYGETAKDSVEVKKTDSGTAAFSGTEMKTETIQPGLDNAASDKKKNTAIAKHKTKATSKEIATGLSYWIEIIKPDGKVERATAESRAFKTGERIRFAFKSNKDGYLYLLAIGSSGKGAILFPDNRINDGRNMIVANSEYKVPFGEKSFVMDPTPGEEKVLVFFSQELVNDITAYFSPKNKLEAQDTRAIYAYAETKGSKDILFEDDAVGGSMQPASYIVNRSNDSKGIIFKEIVVKHK